MLQLDKFIAIVHGEIVKIETAIVVTVTVIISDAIKFQVAHERVLIFNRGLLVVAIVIVAAVTVMTHVIGVLCRVVFGIVGQF